MGMKPTGLFGGSTSAESPRARLPASAAGKPHGFSEPENPQGLYLGTLPPEGEELGSQAAGCADGSGHG